MLLLLLASCQSPTRQAGPDSPHAPDPWVGTYTVFGAHADGFLEYSGVDGAATIRKQGEAYVIDIEPGVLFYPDGSGGLVPRPGHQLIRYITIGYAGEQTALVVQQGFQTLYLLPGVGPAAWVDGDWFSGSSGAADPWASRTRPRPPGGGSASPNGGLAYFPNAAAHANGVLAYHTKQATMVNQRVGSK